MKLITLFKSVLLIIVFSSTTLADTYKASGKSNKKPQSAFFIEKEWFDGDRRRVVWMSLNEVAVVGKQGFYDNANDLIRELGFAFPGSKLLEKASAYARIQLPDQFANSQQLQKFIKQKNAGNNSWNVRNIYHNVADKSSPAFIAAEGIIVHFVEGSSKQNMEQWAVDNNFTISRFLKNSQAVLLDCPSTDSCLDDANRIYKDEKVKYAYPNLVRPRQKKLQPPLLLGRNVDLSVNQTATPNPVVAGNELEISITVQISTSSFVRNLHIKNSLPDGFVFKNATVQGGSCQGTQLVDCSVNNVFPFNNTVTASIIVIPQNNGEFINQVSVESDVSDANPSDNSSNLTITVGEGNTNSLWNDPLFEKQWYFSNTGQNNGLVGADVNILPVWEQGISGNGVLAAIVDDGLEIDHEDLRDNIANGLSWDFVDNDNDPTAEFHGTSVAGILGATGNNSKGVVGAASSSRMLGLRLLGANTDMNEADALSFRTDIVDLSNNSWGPPDDGQGLFGPSPLTEEALQAGVTNGRGGKGIVYCWAAGNGGENDDNSNYDGYANSRYTLAFTASTNKGKQASYAEKGANILANVPSSGGTLQMTTTDRTGQQGLDNGNYTDQFGGTSAATPLACGIVALIMEANPELSWRDIQAIIAKTAEKNDPDDTDWKVNSAGYNINHKYGFGRIDAAAAVEAAKNWILLDSLQQTSGNSNPDIEIPDNNNTGVRSTIAINDNLSVETVEIVFSANDHTFWGDLEITLQSPSGEVSILAEKHNSGQNTAHYDQWKFTSLRHFGESSQGDWMLTVKDLATEDTGTFAAWELNIYGTGEPTNQSGADLSVTVQDTPDPVNLGEPIVYSIIVSNNGPDQATAVVLTDNLPDEIEFSSIETSQGNCNGTKQITCQLGVIQPAEKVNITLNTIALSAGNTVNSINVRGDESDPFMGNNTSTVETEIIDNNVAQHTLTISSNILITSDPEGINCPSDCTATFPEGGKVVLQVASPNQVNSVFWFGDIQCVGSSKVCELEITKDINLNVFAF